MAHLIDKDEAVSKIKRRIDEINEEAALYSSDSEHDYFYRIKEEAYKNSISIINSLKAKEIDLEKEIKEEYLKYRRYDVKNNMLVILNEPQFNNIAKHFFELGFNAGKENKL